MDLLGAFLGIVTTLAAWLLVVVVGVVLHLRGRRPGWGAWVAALGAAVALGYSVCVGYYLQKFASEMLRADGTYPEADAWVRRQVVENALELTASLTVLGVLCWFVGRRLRRASSPAVERRSQDTEGVVVGG